MQEDLTTIKDDMIAFIEGHGMRRSRVTSGKSPVGDVGPEFEP